MRLSTCQGRCSRLRALSQKLFRAKEDASDRSAAQSTGPRQSLTERAIALGSSETTRDRHATRVLC